MKGHDHKIKGFCMTNSVHRVTKSTSDSFMPFQSDGDVGFRVVLTIRGKR